MLAGRFRSREEEEANPRHLDANTISVPDLALRALRLELGRSQSLADECLRSAAVSGADELAIARQRDTLTALAEAIGAFIRKLTASSLPPGLVERLARSLRVLQYQENTVDTCRNAAALAASLGPMPTTELREAFDAFGLAIGELCGAADCERADFSLAALDRRTDEMESRYATLKESLLVAGAHATLDLHGMQERLRHASLLRRAAQQSAKAARHLAVLSADGAPPDRDIDHENPDRNDNGSAETH
jgi:phosphate:Na+ symporter